MLNGTWHKSSHSAHNGNCVEAADGGGQVRVRDSKDTAGAVLAFTPAAWNAFLDSIKGTRPCSA